MKQNFKIIILFIFSLLLSCKKIPFDYRNKFIGDYEFTNKYYPGKKFDGYIHYGKESNQIEIFYGKFTNSIGEEQRDILQANINQNGVFKDTSSTSYPMGEFLNKNEVEFTVIIFTSPMGYGIISYTGKKK